MAKTKNGKNWKGILLAGGRGTRLAPLTEVVNKHLLPVYDKPMIYYPLTTLMMCGIQDVLVVSTPEAIVQLEVLLKDGRQWGLNIEYVIQTEPRGIADCFLCAEKQIEGNNVALILGDNIFYGSGLPQRLEEAKNYTAGATILGYEVANPSAFGVVELNEAGEPTNIVEKPSEPKSNIAIPGLYFYDDRVLGYAQALTPSPRGELEITDINKRYLQDKELHIINMGRGTAWLDGGSHADLFEAGQFIKVVEDRTGLKIACPEEVAFNEKRINKAQLKQLVTDMPSNGYRDYLEKLIL